MYKVFIFKEGLFLLNSLLEAVAEVSEKRSVPTTTEEVFFQKLEELGFNLTELKAFITCDKSMLGLACAGAGKTTALVLKIIYEYITGRLYKTVEINGLLVKQPKKILVSTFLKSGAEDICRVFHDYCKKLGVTGIPFDCITFGTLHSEFYNVIKAMTGVSPKITKSQGSIVRSIMQEYKIRRKDSISTILTNDEVSDMVGLITCYINRLNDETKYQHPLLFEYNLNKPLLDLLVKRYREMLSVMDETDFDVMQEVLYTNMENNAAIQDFIHKRYDVLFVDEFQDTSRLQYALLKEYIKGAERIVAIGDDDQCIYSWRGSDIDIISKYYVEDVHPEVLKLSMNYRCAENILKPVISCICKNEKRYDKELKAARQGGIVEVVSDATGSTIISKVLEDAANYKSIGIISRNNNDLLVPAILLELHGGIEYNVSSGINLESKLVRTILSSIELVTKRYTDNFPIILKSLFKPFEHREVMKLCTLLKTNSSYNIYTLPREDILTSLPYLSEFLLNLRDIKERAGDVATYNAILHYYINVIFKKDTPYNLNGRAIAELLYGLFRPDGALEGKDIYTVERLLLDELPKRIAMRSKQNKVAKIKLSTVHDAKGKEWDCVYIYNFNNDVFPSVLTHRNNKAEYEEERRIAYIAWTRAREKLVVCTSTTKPSPFLHECDLGDIIQNDGEIAVRTRVLNANPTVESVVEKYINAVARNEIVSREMYELLGVVPDIKTALVTTIQTLHTEKNGEEVGELKVADVTRELIEQGVCRLYEEQFPAY